jgi:diaminopimelate epimerase
LWQEIPCNIYKTMNLSKNFFIKSHGLGNEYVVLDSKFIDFPLNEKSIKRICNIHYGIGSDGILLLEPSEKADFKLRIFNPDASEAEKSGNGLRIFAKFLYDYAYTRNKEFKIETLGGIVKAIVAEEKNGKATMITLEMGRAIFQSQEIPVLCNEPECIDFPLVIDGREFKINCVSVGNPHCVIIQENLSTEEVLIYGPKIENHPMFPNRINVQFVKPISRNEVEILIWERGAGYTLASGSSSSAVASIMRKKNYTDNHVVVKMPGGSLKLHVDNNFNIILTGEVKQVAEGILSEELLEEFRK